MTRVCKILAGLTSTDFKGLVDTEMPFVRFAIYEGYEGSALTPLGSLPFARHLLIGQMPVPKKDKSDRDFAVHEGW